VRFVRVFVDLENIFGFQTHPSASGTNAGDNELMMCIQLAGYLPLLNEELFRTPESSKSQGRVVFWSRFQGL